MKPGLESQTAVLVCAGRAAAHGRSPVARYSDPVAMSLLPDDARARVERFRAGEVPKGLRERAAHGYLGAQSKMMVVRTVAIDDAVREADNEQLVILGAGLDGRAWRMAELARTVVFEVDHPDSQRRKKERAAKLVPTAKELRFVPVDFTRDRLDDALAAAGHDPTRPTTWIWEGVVMYLSPAEVEATLEVVEKRSPPRSRLVIAYHAPSLARWLVRFVVARIGEPLKSKFTDVQMRALLARHGFRAIRDANLPVLAQSMSSELVPAMRHIAHLRIVVADRTA